MILRRLAIAALALGLLAPGAARADEEPGPTELVHVPTEELDVLLRADRKGIVLRYAEYERLLAAARARAAALEAQPPVDGTLVSCRGAVDLTPEHAAGLELTYEVDVLADGPRSVDFPLRNLALERVLLQDVDGTPSGRYEEWNGRPRLRFDEPGRRVVTARASAAFSRKGEQRYLDLWLPPASAMALSLRFPAGMHGVVIGEGAPVEVRAPGDAPLVVTARPSRGGHLRVAFAPRAKGREDGPPILDVRTHSLHSVGDGLVHSRVILNADVFRSPVDVLDVRVPEGFAVRALEGKGVTGFTRDASGERIRVQLEKRVLGTVVLTLEGERPYRPGPDVAFPNVSVEGAVRHRAEMAVQFGSDVRVRGLAVDGGRRLPAAPARDQQHLLRYALTRADGSLRVDLEAGTVRLDAMSTYYLNLAEAGKTLIVTTTYRVLEGTVFTLRPRMPGGYELRTVTVDGRVDGFSKDLRADGTLEIALSKGVPHGREISLAATLEQSQADWVPDGEPVQVPLTVPAAGAGREEGLVAVGADAAFRVLESMRNDLVAVGAAELTARGISPAGLVYGYRLDGAKPAVALSVQRHEPVVDASLVSTLLPSPRRLDVVAVVAHRIRRAGVRTLLVDVPAWAPKDQVRFESPYVRGAAMLEGEARPQDVPVGYERWRVDLNQRVIGRHTTVVRYHDDLAAENWSIAAGRPLGVRVPIERAERFVVVQRAEGLEVAVQTEGADVRPIEWTELPGEAAVDPLKALEVLRLANGGEGVGVRVQRHDGAAVLDAVATEVRLRTAVAREGVLRTRAWVQLFNVDRQFLKVLLPGGSELIGAVVNGEAVKVLADPQGVLLVPIPTATKRSGESVASLTYETHLGAPLGGSLQVPGPTFPELEVLHTEHRVAFDPDVRIAGVGGDYGRVSAPAPRPRLPWLLGALAAFGGGGSKGLVGAESGAPSAVTRAPGSGARYTALEEDLEETEGLLREQEILPGEPVIKDEEIRDHVETDNDLPYEESLGQSEGLMDAPFEGPANNGAIGIGGGAGGTFSARRVHALRLRLEAEKSRLASTGSTEDRRIVEELGRALEQARSRLAASERGRAAEVPPSAREPSDPTPAAPPPPSRGPAMGVQPRPAPQRGLARPGGEEGMDAWDRHGAPASDPGDASGDDEDGDGGGGAPRAGGGRTRAHHEGDLPPADGSRSTLRRKGLLSLDVPVVLGPHVVVAQRLGGGGVIEIDLVTDEGAQRAYLLLGLAFLAVGLLAGYGSRLRKGLTLAGGAALALLLGVLFGVAANTVTVALANAVTLLALLWGARGLLGLLMRRGARSAAGVEAAARAGVLGTLLCVLLVCAARTARADEPRPPVPDVKEPRKVFVPYDPADPDKLAAQDRVFLPLETYLKLYKAAHPEEDPELVALGRMVTIVDARYAVQVERSTEAMARGTASFRFAKRGAGPLLVRWPLGGLAVTKATLDGRPVQLLLQKGVYHVAVQAEGDHALELEFRVPVVQAPDGRSLSFDAVAFGRARLEIDAPRFEGDVRVSGAGRVETTVAMREGKPHTHAVAWLGHARRVSVSLAERSPAELPTTVRTRAESRTIHSMRDDGTETQTQVTLYVLQGRAPFVDLGLPEGVRVLDAEGSGVVRWETLATPSPRVRLHFNQPATGAVTFQVRSFRSAASPERSEALADLAVLDTTGESGQVIVNADPAKRVELGATQNLFRIARPKEPLYAGLDGLGRVAGAWRFAARPTSLEVATRRMEPRVDVDSLVAVVVGDDHVRTRLRARVQIDERAPLGTLAFDLPGNDAVRRVISPGMDTWWLQGSDESRRLLVRYTNLRTGALALDVHLERRLGGVRDGVAVPRFALREARRDRGYLTLFALPDVELKAGSVAGLRSLPLIEAKHPAPGVDNARPVYAYAWDAAVGESLPVSLREPELETEAVVVTLVAPDDERHTIEHLVLFDVRRGLTDHLRLFVPDGGYGESGAQRDVVTTRDLREMRRERVTRLDADGSEVAGTLYDLRLQSARDDVIEVTVSQSWRAGTANPVRLVRPEGVSGTHWFSLVRTFLDGTIDVTTAAGRPDTANFQDLPFVPAGLTAGGVYRSFASREPYLLEVRAERHRLQAQAEAVVQAAVATVVLGLDGQARVHVDYRVFNRARQFLRLKLPEGSFLFGATTAGEPVKPLAGKQGTILLPIPKVPLGGKGYPVSVLFRTRAGPDFQRGGAQSLLLPTVVDGVEVDRTVVRLFVPDGYDYDFESRMTPTTASDVAADLAEVAVREARDLLKLAEKGTLTQRWAAAQNGLALIAHARTKLNQAPESWSSHRSLAGELNVLGKQLEKERDAAQQDLAEARRQTEQSGPSVEEFASNARNIVSLDDEGNAPSDGPRADDETLGRNKAGWVLNPQKGAAVEGKAGYDKLRTRLKSKLEGRAQNAQRKNFKNVQDQSKQPSGAQEAAPLPTQTFDYKQVDWLNDTLKKEQQRNRQMGAVDARSLDTFFAQAGQQAGPGQSVLVDGGRLSRVFQGPRNNGPIGIGGQSREAEELALLAQRSSNYFFNGALRQQLGTETATLPTLGDRPSAGAYFNDGEGDFRARAENVFGVQIQGLGGRVPGSLVDLDDVTNGLGDRAGGVPSAKRGLMGVDVDLPRVGKVYYFRSLRAGAPIEVRASREDGALGWRIALLALVLVGAVATGVLVRRRRAVAASA